ncbi:unnamed protein product [Effrenium voratum]|uniref:Uncharacterized protein n=1 Tax=Effrenium voratum TaxID=2562239 RepID=A0AA36JM12_9DINO|nr:unnamed protein product [Effrenium voratum]CAJ1451820.1 unnamed protein product [Effrenium voratum]
MRGATRMVGTLRTSRFQLRHGRHVFQAAGPPLATGRPFQCLSHSTKAGDEAPLAPRPSEVLDMEDDEEDTDEEEENPPPWRQLKPWRWRPAEEDLGWLKMFQLPKVQEEETGRSYIVGIYTAGICLFFTAVWWGPPQVRAIFRKEPAPSAPSA